MSTNATTDAKRRGTDMAINTLNTIENKRNELVGAVQEQYDRVRGKAQEVKGNLATKGDEVKQKVGHQLRGYNDLLQGKAEQLPGNMNELIPQYPWVALTFAIIAGFILGLMFAPRR
jgi:ElaB/YqjD/DUF883 family membrane-anchored ribosome-binding protein